MFGDDEAQKLVAACLELNSKAGNRAYLAIILNFLLGLRAGELVALQYEDFDFDRHLLFVQRSEVRERDLIDGKFVSRRVEVVPYLKAGHDRREVVIDEALTEQLVEYIRKSYPGEWLFARKDGSRLSEAAYHHAMAKATDRAGIPHRSNHKIRKTVISKMIQSGLFSDTDVRDRAGHNDYSTTQRYYAYALPGGFGEQSAKIGEVLDFDLPLQLFLAL